METGLLKFHNTVEEFIKYLQRKDKEHLGCMYATHWHNSIDCKSKFVIENPSLCGYCQDSKCTYKRTNLH